MSSFYKPGAKPTSATHAALAGLGVLGTEPAKPIESVRRYTAAFITALRDNGHSAEDARTVLREYADMVIAAPKGPQ